jgi:hypothetical protein
MLAPKARTNLPFESNFWIGAHEFEEQRSNTQMFCRRHGRPGP